MMSLQILVTPLKTFSFTLFVFWKSFPRKFFPHTIKSDIIDECSLKTAIVKKNNNCFENIYFLDNDDDKKKTGNSDGSLTTPVKCFILIQKDIARTEREAFFITLPLQSRYNEMNYDRQEIFHLHSTTFW